MGGPNPRQSRDAATMSKTTTIKITRRIITAHLSCLDTTATMRRSTTLHRIVPVAGAPPRAVGFHRTFRRLASISFIPFISMPACPHMTPKAAPPPATTSSIPLVLSARSFPGSRSVIYPAFPRWRPEQAGLAYVLDGEHADELSFLGDRQRPETALLQGGKSLLEKGSLRRDGGNTRLHQLTHACVPLRGVGCGHDLLTRDHADEVPILVHDGEVFLVAVDHRVQHLPEGVVGRNGFGVRLGTHDVRDTKAARLLPLSDHLGLSVRAEEDEDGDEGEQEVATEQSYQEEGEGEQLPHPRSDLRGPECSQAGCEHSPQHASPVQREGWDQVEECQNYIEVAQIEEELPHRPNPCEQIGWHARYRSQKKTQTEEDRGEHHVHQGTGEGYLDFIGRLLRQRLQIGDSAYGQKGYAVNLDAQALCHQGVAELVQEHADEQSHYQGCRRERPGQAS